MDTTESTRPPLVPSTRFTLALLVFFAFIVQYSQRTNLPIAIVCMVNKTVKVSTNSSFKSTTIAPSNNSTELPGDSSTEVPDKTSTGVPSGSSTEVPDKTSTGVPNGSSTEVPNGSSTEVPDETSTGVPDGSSTGVPDGSSTEVSNDSSTGSSSSAKTTRMRRSAYSGLKKNTIPPSKKRIVFQDRVFLWTEFHQQLLLGGYWAGYIFTQVPGGWLATTIGAKWVYAGSLGTSSIATVALTMLYRTTEIHLYLAFILRFIIGLAHGVLFPATVALWSLWAVPQERSTLASIGFCGTHLGTSITTLIGGALCSYIQSGWMFLFFLSSILGFIWLALWIKLTSDAPHTHPTISGHEREYISSYTGSSGKKRTMSLASIPWRNIIKCKPLMALMVTHIANLFGLFFFLTNFAKILTQVLHMQTQSAGYLLAFGYFLTWLSSLLSGIATDHLVRSQTLTLTQARKISNGLTSFIPVVCMFFLFFCDHERYRLGIITVLLFLASSGLGYGSGYVVNFADIVPAYSGVIFGIANTFASLAGLIGNMIAGVVIKSSALEQWRKLYVMFGVVYFIGGLVFVLYGSAVPRKWAKFESVEPAHKLEERSADVEAKPSTTTKKI